MSGRSKFVAKLHSTLEHPIDPDSLRWVSDTAFEVTMDDARAVNALGPAFEFGSLNSFIRQLSYYNFKRISDRRRSTEHKDGPLEHIVFSHASGFFVRGDASNLANIKRQPKKRKGAAVERRASTSSSSPVDTQHASGSVSPAAIEESEYALGRAADWMAGGGDGFWATLPPAVDLGQPILAGKGRSQSNGDLPRNAVLAAWADVAPYPLYSMSNEGAGSRFTHDQMDRTDARPANTLLRRASDYTSVGAASPLGFQAHLPQMAHTRMEEGTGNLMTMGTQGAESGLHSIQHPSWDSGKHPSALWQHAPPPTHGHNPPLERAGQNQVAILPTFNDTYRSSQWQSRQGLYMAGVAMGSSHTQSSMWTTGVGQESAYYTPSTARSAPQDDVCAPSSFTSLSQPTPSSYIPPAFYPGQEDLPEWHGQHGTLPPQQLYDHQRPGHCNVNSQGFQPASQRMQPQAHHQQPRP